MLERRRIYNRYKIFTNFITSEGDIIKTADGYYFNVTEMPYDSKVSFIESSNSEYINTGIKKAATTEKLVIKAKVCFTATPSGETDLVGSGNGNTPTMGIKGGYYFLWAYSGTAWQPVAVNTKWHNISYQFNYGTGRVFTLDGTVYTDANKRNEFSGGTNTLYVFAKGPNIYPAKCKLREITIEIDDNVVFDAYAVRVGSVGYLYDKVSGQLFGNAGSGSFIVGSDIN